MHQSASPLVKVNHNHQCNMLLMCKAVLRYNLKANHNKKLDAIAHLTAVLRYNLKANHNLSVTEEKTSKVVLRYNLCMLFYLIKKYASVGFASCESESQPTPGYLVLKPSYSKIQFETQSRRWLANVFFNSGCSKIQFMHALPFNKEACISRLCLL